MPELDLTAITAACIVGRMATLLERVRAALAPSYRVEAVLGVGGMGEVFRAIDVQLERPVAVKVLRPEAATAVAVERFLREARLLARLSHPNIVPVHHAGEAQGLYYFVMELQAGETLAARLERGPLPVAEAIAIGRGLLAALAVAHGADIIHRDVKPSNVFLEGGGARLGDFGIAHSDSDPGLTRSGDTVGTVAYMAPEQRAGRPATHRTDLYAVGAVAYECLTGRRWAEAQGDWSRVPPAVVPVLRRALEQDPAARWPDALAFGAALDGAATAAAAPPRRDEWRAWITAAAILVVPAAMIGLTILAQRRGPDPGPPRREPTPSGPLVVSLAPFAGDSSGPAAMVERQLRRRLSEAGVWPGGDSGSAAPDLTLISSVDRDGDDLVVDLSAQGDRGDLQDLHVERRGPASGAGALGDSLAVDAVLELWRLGNRDAPPRAVLPRRLGALLAWAAAERHFDRAEWNDARQAYSRAFREDSTCLLCAWRLQLIARWYQSPASPEQVRWLAARADRFPDPFRSLIRATAEPFPARIDSLLATRSRFSRDHLAQFLHGDELLHRGPLTGTPRRAAAEAFDNAARLRRGFLPALEHAAWLHIAEGDERAALPALDAYTRGLDGDPFATSIAALLVTAARWRFAGPEAGRAVLDTLLAEPGLARSELAGAAPRFLVWFGAPEGALDLAGRFLADPAFGSHRTTAVHARAFALTSLGRPDSAVAALGALADPAETARWRALLAGAIAAADPADPAAAVLASGYRAGLAAVAADRRRPELAAEAALIASLLGDDPSAVPAGPERVLAEAAAVARDGRPRDALARTEPLRALETASGPFFRAFLHLRRGEWHAALGDSAGALGEWLWHENQDVEGSLLGPPVSADVDWALGTLARWRRAELARTRPERRADACRNYVEVLRLWAGGNATARARADSARAARRALACEAA